MKVTRSKHNPLILPDNVKPSRDDFEVHYVMNCGVTRFEGDVLLLLRVAETPINHDPKVVLAPRFDETTGEIEIKSFDKSDDRIQFDDPRFIEAPWDRILTTISHFRVARSKDGIHFDVEDTPAMFPANKYEEFGIEDPRITLIGDTYWINYSCCASLGVTTCLASTKDFKNFERHGVIFTPDNKDVCIFPDKINGKYWAMNRPASAEYKRREMWISESVDLIGWGNHKQLVEVNQSDWDNGRIGCSSVPHLTDKGWLEIYHAADANDRYSLGAILMDKNDPSKVIAKSKKPIMEPTASYEKWGFYGPVIFNCGCLIEDDIIKLYYGAADTSVAYAEMSLSELLDELLTENGIK
ncbi:MAG: glycoside hydrolase family 130 protein [Bacteroidota bacterium]